MISGGVQHCGKHCLAENDNQWLGVSLSRQPSKGHVLVCLLVKACTSFTKAVFTVFDQKYSNNVKHNCNLE